MAVAEVPQRAVPKPNPGFDAAACSTQSPLLPIRRVRDQILDQLAPHGAMAVAIEFDVPIDVVDEMSGLSPSGGSAGAMVRAHPDGCPDKAAETKFYQRQTATSAIVAPAISRKEFRHLGSLSTR